MDFLANPIYFFPPSPIKILFLTHLLVEVTQRGNKQNQWKKSNRCSSLKPTPIKLSVVQF